MSFENKKDPARRSHLFARQFGLSNLNIISEAGLKVRLSYKMTNLSNHILYAQVTDDTGRCQWIDENNAKILTHTTDSTQRLPNHVQTSDYRRQLNFTVL